MQPATKTTHKSTASRLRAELHSVSARLAELVKTLPIRRSKLDDDGGFIVMVRRDYYFGERSAEQKAAQLSLKREYDIAAEILKLLVRGGPDELVNELSEADAQFRQWLDLESWSISANPADNAQAVLAALEPLGRILDVLDSASKELVIVIPDTNSLIADADPTSYRGIAGRDSFVFLLLPTVLGELDKLKVAHRDLDVREKARKVIDRIKGWRLQGLLIKGVTVDKSITVRAVYREPDVKNSLSWLDPDNNDDRIIASVLSVQAEFPSAQVILISGDTNLLNKADAAIIETAELP